MTSYTFTLVLTETERAALQEALNCLEIVSAPADSDSPAARFKRERNRMAVGSIRNKLMGAGPSLASQYVTGDNAG